MSTSPRSELTVLLWGDRWWLPQHKMPVPFTEMAQAADQLAAAWPEAIRALRIVFQPDDLATVPVDCPNGNRATLTLALAEEHPVLTHPGHVWSHEPILPKGERFGTLLHYETRPVLFGLVHRLRELGFTVSGVVPMATWLDALPPELTETGTITICALSAERFCLYRHSGDGVRAFRSGHGGDVTTAVARHLSAVPAQAATEFVLYVTTDEKLVDQLAQRVPIDEHHVVGVFSLPHALGRATVISARHPAQLLPPVPFVTPPQIVTLLALVLTVGAGLLAVPPAQAWWSARQATEENERECTRLEAELVPLRRNEEAVREIRRRAAEFEQARLPVADLLDAISRRLPAGLVLTRLTVDRTGFVLEGGAANAAAEVAWNAWLDGLRRGAGWQATELPAVAPTRDFTIRGVWR